MRNSIENNLTPNQELNTEDEDNVTSLQWMVSKASTQLSLYLKTTEDDGSSLKSTDCCAAWRELESAVIKSIKSIREGLVRCTPILKLTIRDAKALLEEVCLRIRVHDVSLELHKAIYYCFNALNDVDKLKARKFLEKYAEELESILKKNRGRFHAAQNDFNYSKRVLKVIN